MKKSVAEIIEEAYASVKSEGLLSEAPRPAIVVEKPKKAEHGDYATNLAMLLAPVEKKAPRVIAEILAERIGRAPEVESVDIAGPGFINIIIKASCWIDKLMEIGERGSDFGTSNVGAGRKVQVEFVSANPTGPLHIGHGRGAAVGDVLARILTATGHDVTREYYINDVGNQMNTLARSVYFRYLELLGVEQEFPDDHYQGDYIRDIARDFVTSSGEKYREISEDEIPVVFRDAAKDAILAGIKKDLDEFGIGFDVWYSEGSLFERDLVLSTIEELRRKGHVYDKDGAVWLATSEYGDDKDRVLIKADGSTTYFASDIAYHREKLERGFSKIIDIWGADHHGYLPRVKALFRALGEDDEALSVVFIQLVSLIRGGEPVAMSTRSGEFITLKEVLDEVGADACRFFFLMRKSDAQLEFDLDLAKSAAPENPVYYVQYGHARIASVIEHAKEKGLMLPATDDRTALEPLSGEEDQDIIKALADFEDVVEKSALSSEPHRITYYLQDLAGRFHSYYTRHRVVGDSRELSLARLRLCAAVKGVLACGLGLLGVSAPEKM